jgi:DnaJ-class molecular chaperone
VGQPGTEVPDVVGLIRTTLTKGRNRATNPASENIMANEKGPNVKKKQKCKNCEGKGLVKKGDRVVKCQRCGGTGVR